VLESRPFRPSKRRLALSGYLCCPYRRGRWLRHAILRGPGSEDPSRKRGNEFLFDALGVNWRVRMSKVQSTGNPHCTEPRKAGSGRSRTNPAARHAMIMSRDFPPSPVGQVQGKNESGRATGRGRFVSYRARPCRAQRTRKRVELVLSLWETDAVFPRPADIFREPRKASARDRSFRRADALEFSPSGDFRTTETKLRYFSGCKRGLKLCR
jgi:hypothetical protein